MSPDDLDKETFGRTQMEVVCLAVQTHRFFNALVKYAGSSLKRTHT